MDEVDLSDGSTKKVVWHLNAWKNSDGVSIGIMLTVDDITRIKELEYELFMAKNLLSEKGAIAKIGSWEYDVENEQLILSDVTKKIFKIKKNSNISIKSLIGFCGEKDTEEIIKTTLYDAIENGIPWDRSLPILLGDATTIRVNTIGRPKFKNGKCKRIIGTVQIVNSEVANVIEEQEETDFFFEEAPMAMALVDFSNGHILKTNDELLDLSGYERTELEGKNCLGFFKNKISKSRLIKESADQKQHIATSLDFTDKNGNKRVLSVKGKLVNDDSDLLCTLEDITKQTKQIIDLKCEVNKGEEELDNLVNFTRLISHNLKGHAINYGLMFDFLENIEDKKEEKKILDVLRHSTDNLSENIIDLKEMVAIRKGIKTKKERLVINDFIFKAEQNLSGELKQSKAKILNEIPNALKIKSYPVYLENILTNCMSNAVKFRKLNKTPLITISTSITKQNTIILIEDNGIGMDLNKKGDKLFKIGSSLSNDHESRGMGLYLVKYQMEIMKGKIEVESAPNEGTTIKLLFPHS